MKTKGRQKWNPKFTARMENQRRLTQPPNVTPSTVRTAQRPAPSARPGSVAYAARLAGSLGIPGSGRIH